MYKTIKAAAKPPREETRKIKRFLSEYRRAKQILADNYYTRKISRISGEIGCIIDDWMTAHPKTLLVIVGILMLIGFTIE